MNKYCCLLTLCCAVSLVRPTTGHAAGPTAFTGTIVINAENGVREIKRSELAAIFLGRKSTWASGKKIIPALQSSTGPVTQEFVRAVLGKSLSQYRAYWKRRLFSGGGTVPRTMPTAKEVMAFVARHPGALGVVEGLSQQDDQIGVVKITD